jgi:hypothetical protein
MREAAALLAMTRLTANAVYLMGAMYLVLSVHALIGGWRGAKHPPKIRLLWFLLLPITLFVTLWFCGDWIWTIIWWLYVFGDVGPYEEYARSTSSIVAIVVSATVLTRLARGKINLPYLRIVSWCTVTLAALFFTLRTHEFTEQIYGWSAQGAAENYFSSGHCTDPQSTKQIVEVSADISDIANSRVRTFVLYCGDDPQWCINVAPYGAFWWTIGGSTNAPDELKKYARGETR